MTAVSLCVSCFLLSMLIICLTSHTIAINISPLQKLLHQYQDLDDQVVNISGKSGKGHENTAINNETLDEEMIDDATEQNDVRDRTDDIQVVTTSKHLRRILGMLNSKREDGARQSFAGSSPINILVVGAPGRSIEKAAGNAKRSINIKDYESDDYIDRRRHHHHHHHHHHHGNNRLN